MGNISILFCRWGKYNSMMIPIVDENGKIVGIKYRTIDKKLSSEAGSQINYFVNWHNIKDFSYVVIVEGEIDLLSLLRRGITTWFLCHLGLKISSV